MKIKRVLSLFTGLYIYRVTVGSGIKFLGRIDTAPAGSTYYWPEWTRGVFIGDYVYAVTSEAIKATFLEDIGGTIWSLGLGD